MRGEAYASAWLSFGVDCFAIELDGAMNTWLRFFAGIYTLQILRARRPHSTLSGGAASRLPVEMWDLLLQVTLRTAKETFKDEMHDLTSRTMCDECESEIEPDIRLRWSDHPSVHKDSDCWDCYALAERVVKQIYDKERGIELFLATYGLAVDWYRWPQSRNSLDYPEEVEAEAEEEGWEFNVAQTEFVRLRYRSSLDKVLGYASASASYGMSTETTKLPPTEKVIATLSNPCWNRTFRKFFEDWDFSDVQSRLPAFPDGKWKPALRLESKLEIYEWR
ncbi:nucleic-acid-binding protein [Rhodotorula toruloides ATCC 204091]|uniref:Nucleic-acid-binding protein n=1 Tax=Rhodotorula toruloides TaxID=5286 RepID=A0A0K3CJ82_RHOTO|nr:nucleic-acid-binding protein [Rhodotorula toruloides ATCC 204091]KAK4332314.1 nucleic-acid-binding protein [Rhodotorula toruloides]PRQ72584.1 nucleic-acid-binding protein [Rhodotorula toruloides]